MDLETDTFRVRHDASVIALEGIFDQIRKLGYKPRAIQSDPADTAPADAGTELPEPIRTAAQTAQKAKQLLFVDFYAEWCAPCKTLEKTVLSAPEVREALRGYHFLKVDTDSFPQAATHFAVMAMPTLLILDADGSELHRQVGPISKPDLIKLLQSRKQR